MGHDVLDGDVVKLKDVVDHVRLVLFNRAFLVADVDHHADLLLGDLLRLVLRADVDQLEDGVGADREKGDKGLGDGEDKADDGRDGQRNLFRVVHGDALGHKLTENQVEVTEDQGDDKQRDRLGHRVRDNGGHQLSDRLRELLRSGTGGQKARHGDADLDGGEELGGLLHHLVEGGGALVSVLSQLFELVVVEGDDGDLAHREEGVDADEDEKNYQLQNDTVTVRVHFDLLFCKSMFLFSTHDRF